MLASVLQCGRWSDRESWPLAKRATTAGRLNCITHTLSVHSNNTPQLHSREVHRLQSRDCACMWSRGSRFALRGLRIETMEIYMCSMGSRFHVINAESEWAAGDSSRRQLRFMRGGGCVPKVRWCSWGASSETKLHAIAAPPKSACKSEPAVRKRFKGMRVAVVSRSNFTRLLRRHYFTILALD